MNEQDAINLLGPSASYNSGMVNNAFSMMYNMYESERGRRFAASQAQQQRDYLTQMWYLNNEYNSPIEQMKRLREAGLNPSLVYGQPVSEAQQPSGAAEASSGLLGAPHLTNPAAGLETVFADIDLKRAQAENLRSQIPVNDQKVNLLKAQFDDTLASISQRYADVQLKYSHVALNDATRENISFEQMYKSGLLDLDYQRLGLERGLTNAQIGKLEAETKELLARAGVTERQLQEMIWTYSVRAQGLEKQNLLTDAQIAQAKATAEKLGKEGVRVAQLTAIDAPKEINSQSWADDMSGKNGVVNQIGASITYQIVDGIKQVGGILLK